MKYDKESSTRKIEKLPDPPAGTYIMKCVWEGPSKKGFSDHSFLFKNDKYQVFYNCYWQQIAGIAKAMGLKLDDDGNIDTVNLRKVSVKLTVEEQASKRGGTFPKIVRFEAIKEELEIDTKYPPMKIPENVQDDMDITF